MRSAELAENLAAGQRIASRFVLEERLRDAPFWSTWRARDASLNASVMLCVVRAEMVDEHARAVFVRDMNRVRTLINRALPELLSVGFEGSTPVVAYGLVEGVTLREPMSRGQRLRAADVGRVIVELSVAIDAMHGLRPAMVHRAISPETVLMAVRPARALLDGAGIAHALGEALGLPVTGASARYLSPDEIIGKVDRRTDIFELASLAFECLTSKSAFEGENLTQIESAILRGPRPSARALRSELPIEVDEILAKAWSVDPLAVYSSAAAFSRDLNSMLSIVTGVVAPGRRAQQTLMGAAAPPIGAFAAASADVTRPDAPKPLGVRDPKKPPPFSSVRSTAKASPPPPSEPPPAPSDETSRSVPPPLPVGATGKNKALPSDDAAKALNPAPKALPFASSAPTVIGLGTDVPSFSEPPTAARADETLAQSALPLEEDVDRAFDEMFAADRPNDADTVRAPRPIAASILAEDPPGSRRRAKTPPPVLPSGTRPSAPPVAVATPPGPPPPREPSINPDAPAEGATERFRQPTQKVLVPQIRPAGTAPLSSDRPPRDVDATEFPSSRATLTDGSHPPPSRASEAPVVTEDLWESLDVHPEILEVEAPIAPTPAVEATRDIAALAGEVLESAKAPSASPFAPKALVPDLSIAPAEPLFSEVPSVPVPPPRLADPALAATSPLAPDDPARMAPPAVPAAPPRAPAPVSVPPRMPSSVPFPRPGSMPTEKIRAIDSRDSVAVRVARILGPSLVLAAAIVTGGQIYLARAPRPQPAPPVVVRVPAPVVAVPTPAPTPDASLARDASAPAVAPSVAPAADAAVDVALAASPDVLAARDAPDLAHDAAPDAAVVAVADAGAAPERLERHPRGRAVTAIEDRMYDTILRCVRDIPHRHRLRLSVTWAGATGRATSVRVGGSYADPPTGPCIEEAARSMSVGPFTDAEWELAFSFVVDD